MHIPFGKPIKQTPQMAGPSRVLFSIQDESVAAPAKGKAEENNAENNEAKDSNHRTSSNGPELSCGDPEGTLENRVNGTLS